MTRFGYSICQLLTTTKTKKDAGSEAWRPSSAPRREICRFVAASTTPPDRRSKFVIFVVAMVMMCFLVSGRASAMDVFGHPKSSYILGRSTAALTVHENAMDAVDDDKPVAAMTGGRSVTSSANIMDNNFVVNSELDTSREHRIDVQDGNAKHPVRRHARHSASESSRSFHNESFTHLQICPKLVDFALPCLYNKTREHTDQQLHEKLQILMSAVNRSSSNFEAFHALYSENQASHFIDCTAYALLRAQCSFNVNCSAISSHIRQSPRIIDDSSRTEEQTEKISSGTIRRRKRSTVDNSMKAEDYSKVMQHVDEVEKMINCQLCVPQRIIEIISRRAEIEYIPDYSIVHRCPNASVCKNRDAVCKPRKIEVVATPFLTRNQSRYEVKYVDLRHHVECICSDSEESATTVFVGQKPLSNFSSTCFSSSSDNPAKNKKRTCYCEKNKRRCEGNAHGDEDDSSTLCRCPTPFLKGNRTEQSCRCSSRNSECKEIYKGHSKLAPKELKCIKKGRCFRDICSKHLSLNMTSGICVGKDQLS